MFGVRVAPLLGRCLARSAPTYTMPKFNYCMANQYG